MFNQNNKEFSNLIEKFIKIIGNNTIDSLMVKKNSDNNYSINGSEFIIPKELSKDFEDFKILFKKIEEKDYDLNNDINKVSTTLSQFILLNPSKNNFLVKENFLDNYLKEIIDFIKDSLKNPENNLFPELKEVIKNKDLDLKKIDSNILNKRITDPYNTMYNNQNNMKPLVSLDGIKNPKFEDIMSDNHTFKDKLEVFQDIYKTLIDFKDKGLFTYDIFVEYKSIEDAIKEIEYKLRIKEIEQKIRLDGLDLGDVVDYLKKVFNANFKFPEKEITLKKEYATYLESTSPKTPKPYKLEPMVY